MYEATKQWISLARHLSLFVKHTTSISIIPGFVLALALNWHIAKQK